MFETSEWMDEKRIRTERSDVVAECCHLAVKIGIKHDVSIRSRIPLIESTPDKKKSDELVPLIKSNIK